MTPILKTKDELNINELFKKSNEHTEDFKLLILQVKEHYDAIEKLQDEIIKMNLVFTELQKILKSNPSKTENK
jgi:hypothetical protein